LALGWHGKALQRQLELAVVDPQDARRRLTGDTATVIKPTDFQTDLAETYIARGVVLEGLSEPARPEPSYEEALKILVPLTKEHPGMTGPGRNHARALSYLGALHGSLDKLKEADTILRRLVHNNPNVILFRAAAAQNTSARGELRCRAARSA